jgi:uncharacterized protein involved in cysteine biosynthesis
MPFEYYFLKLPIVSVLMIRTLATGTNLFWYKNWMESKIWQRFDKRTDAEKLIQQQLRLPFHISISRMVVMKLLVNLTNFTILFCIAMLLADIYDTGLHFTLEGFMKKVGYVTLFAIIATWPYETLLKLFGFESNQIDEVDIASDI